MRRCAPEWPTRGSPTATLAVLTVATATWAQQWRCRWTGGGREGAHRALAALRRAMAPLAVIAADTHRAAAAGAAQQREPRGRAMQSARAATPLTCSSAMLACDPSAALQRLLRRLAATQRRRASE